MDNRRLVFLSATFLSKQYKSIPVEVLENAVFFFGSKRSWLFPANREEMLEARNNPSKYLEFDEDYKTLIRHKENQNLVFWLLPDKDYKKASALIEAIEDPVSKENYLPLILDEAWWKTGIFYTLPFTYFLLLNSCYSLLLSSSVF
jgi:hypothetical protein